MSDGPLIIIGAGPAGLAAGQRAAELGVPFRLLEASDRIGGGCTTFEHGAFRFDAGAHRLHDRAPPVTAALQDLLGDDLQPVTAPSGIRHRGRLIAFPPRPLDLLAGLGTRGALQAGADALSARLRPPLDRSFAGLAVRRYGRSVADRFLLGYSEKLWGLPADQLSPIIAGGRLKGLSLRGAIVEAVAGPRARPQHLEGRFLYPRKGIGAICEVLAADIGDHIRTSARVVGVRHDGGRARQVVLAEGEVLDASAIIATCPLPALVAGLDPPLPDPALASVDRLRFRSLVLVALFLDVADVTDNATIYFPDPTVPFTRIHEPKRRSAAMSPPGQTSLVAELPCFIDDATWQQEDDRLVARVLTDLVAVGLMKRSDVLEARVMRVPDAYPVLSLDHEAAVAAVTTAVGKLQNLALVGRPATFRYSHLHESIAEGWAAVERVKSRPWGAATG